MSIAPETISDIEILEQLDWSEDDSLPCNYGNGACEREASWTIQCPECGNTEPSCTEHDHEMATQWDPMTVIIFDCSHAHPLIDCPRKPI
jgi:hypothetical protein